VLGALHRLIPDISALDPPMPIINCPKLDMVSLIHPNWESRKLRRQVSTALLTQKHPDLHIQFYKVEDGDGAVLKIVIQRGQTAA
jgi:hypothetical protein